MWNPLGRLHQQGVLAAYGTPPAPAQQPGRPTHQRPNRPGPGMGPGGSPFDMDMVNQYLSHVPNFQWPTGALQALQGLPSAATWQQAASALQPYNQQFAAMNLPGPVGRYFGSF